MPAGIAIYGFCIAHALTVAKSDPDLHDPLEQEPP
jgi:hypothetical protein